MRKEIIHTENAPQPIGPYSQAVKFGNLLFISGQIALQADGTSLIGHSIEDETHQVMKNIKSILAKADLDFNDVIKISIYMKDLNLFSKVNETYGTYFTTDTAPARETVEISNLPKNANIEMSIIAGIG
jgi:2-iminobutanoate/2-iminopropanoate deaminase